MEKLRRRVMFIQTLIPGIFFEYGVAVARLSNAFVIRFCWSGKRTSENRFGLYQMYGFF